MNNLNEVCGVGQGCSSDVIYACTCGDPVILFCRDCLPIHLLECYTTHLLIPLDQARRLIEDRSYYDSIQKNLHDFYTIKIALIDYISKIQKFKQDLRTLKTELIQAIDKEFSSKIEAMDILQQSTNDLLLAIKKNMRSHSSVGEDIARKYNQDGLAGIIDNYIEHMSVDRKSVLDSLKNAIKLSKHSLEEFQSSSCLFALKNGTRQIVKYDIITNQTSYHDLSSVVNYYLNNTSVCVVPDGNVIIVGSYSPNSGDTYKFNVSTGICTKLGGLNTPRGWIHLICVGDTLYALGGHNGSILNICESMKWNGSGWSTLPNMKEARYLFGTCTTNSKIFIFGGESRNSVEYYDIKRNSFALLPEVGLNLSYSCVGIIDDKIYVLASSQVNILSKDLKVLEPGYYIGGNYPQCISGKIVKGNEIYFYNHNGSVIQAFDSTTKQIRDLIYI